MTPEEYKMPVLWSSWLRIRERLPEPAMRKQEDEEEKQAEKGQPELQPEEELPNTE